MQVKTFNVGKLSTNCYVVNCSETGEAIIIDPGFDYLFETEQIIHHVEENNLKVRFIVNTHGHADHISGAAVLKRKYDVPIYIHTYDAYCLNNLGENLSSVIILLEDGGLLKFGQVILKVMHTPGHTRGSISLIGEKLVFTGDTLFAGGIGRTDLPGGSANDIKLSLEKLLCIPEYYVIYPGHGASSTIGEEKRDNPFLQWP